MWLLMEVIQISEHVVTYYKNLFCTNFVLKEQLLDEEVIPHSITDEIKVMLTMLPSHIEIRDAVFSLNKDSSPCSQVLEPFSSNCFLEYCQR